LDHVRLEKVEARIRNKGELEWPKDYAVRQ
jgi:hypothetical protein